MKKIAKIFGILMLVLTVSVTSYVTYLFVDYYRLEDNLVLDHQNQDQEASFKIGQSYSMMTFNIGYGSYPDDFSFFMDGGSEVRARSKNLVKTLLEEDVQLVEKADPDLLVLQEVDVWGHRSQKVNQVAYLTDSLPDYAWSFASNYDSSYLFYPITKPIGKAQSGLLTLSRVKFDQAKRYSLPVDTDWTKFFDIDRAFSVNRFKVDKDRDLVVMNVHLSAYTQNQSIQIQQIEKLVGMMEEEDRKGHYVIVGGDFNHALSGQGYEELTWMKDFPREMLPSDFMIVSSENAPTVRHIDTAYDPDKTLTGVIDGFIVSDKIEVKSVETINNSFHSSDHNPVLMEFVLKE